MPGGDHLRGHLGLHLAAATASVRSGLAHRLPAFRPVEPGPGLGPTAPGRPRRARRPRRAGLVAVRDRLRQHPGGKRGLLTGPNPTDRGKSGSKVHLITDRNGVPLSLGISGANMHDSLGLEALVRGIPPIRSRRGPRRRRRGPAKTPCRQGIRLRPPAEMVARASHLPPHRPQGRRVVHAAQPTPLGRRENGLLAGRVPTPAPPLRAQGRALPGLRRHRRSPHQLPPTHPVKRRLTRQMKRSVTAAGDQALYVTGLASEWSSAISCPVRFPGQPILWPRPSLQGAPQPRAGTAAHGCCRTVWRPTSSGRDR